MIKLISITLIVLNINCFSQSSECDSIFKNAHGLTRANMLYFEVEGYSGFTNVHDNIFFDDKGIRIAKRKYNIPKESQGKIDSFLSVKHQYFITDYTITDGLNQKNVFYFIPQENNQLKVIAFSRAPDRDIEVERLFVKSIAQNSLHGNIVSSPGTHLIDFAGREIELGGVCRWMGPHNIQCPDYGQISWPIFRTLDDAKKNAETNFQITANKKFGEVLEKDSIDVIFEGIETKALKTIYKIKIPQLIMGGSNILIIYYVASEVRGKYVSCTMSQYTDDVNAKELAPLLHEVMSLKK
jgi:hypothetical protein